GGRQGGRVAEAEGGPATEGVRSKESTASRNEEKARRAAREIRRAEPSAGGGFTARDPHRSRSEDHGCDGGKTDPARGQTANIGGLGRGAGISEKSRRGF